MQNKVTYSAVFYHYDQTTRLCFQYLAIFSNENLLESIQIVPKWAENFAQNQINFKYIAKDF